MSRKGVLSCDMGNNTMTAESKLTYIKTFKFILYSLTALGCFPLNYNESNRHHFILITYSSCVTLLLTMLLCMSIYGCRPWENHFGQVMITQIIIITFFL